MEYPVGWKKNGCWFLGKVKAEEEDGGLLKHLLCHSRTLLSYGCHCGLAEVRGYSTLLVTTFLPVSLRHISLTLPATFRGRNNTSTDYEYQLSNLYAISGMWVTVTGQRRTVHLGPQPWSPPCKTWPSLPFVLELKERPMACLEANEVQSVGFSGWGHAHHILHLPAGRPC